VILGRVGGWVCCRELGRLVMMFLICLCIFGLGCEMRILLSLVMLSGFISVR